jgi:nucleoside-diphosphate kinase
MASGPVVAMVWEGRDAILGGRRLLGATRPAESAVGTLRGDYAIDVGRNIIHGSDGPEAAQHEIAHWFKPEEVVAWTPVEAAWVYEPARGK